MIGRDWFEDSDAWMGSRITVDGEAYLAHRDWKGAKVYNLNAAHRWAELSIDERLGRFRHNTQPDTPLIECEPGVDDTEDSADSGNGNRDYVFQPKMHQTHIYDNVLYRIRAAQLKCHL